MAIRTLCSDSVRMAIHFFFVDFDVFKSLYLSSLINTKLWDFVNLGALFLTTW